MPDTTPPQARTLAITAYPPSGRQHEIRHADHVAIVTEVGAALRSYAVGSREVLDGFARDAMADGGRGQVLAPWPNRVRDGTWTWAGVELQLGLTEAAKRNAIHGFVRWVAWDLDDATEDRVSLTTTVWPQPGYPFRLALRATYALDDDGLTVTLTARNESSRPAPYGIGQHPYLAAITATGPTTNASPDAPLDGCLLTVPATTRLLTDERGNPVGTESVAGTTYDFRTARPIDDLVLDTAFTDLLPDQDGRSRVRLDRPDGTFTELWADGSTRWLQVFSGDTLAEGRRRQGLAVEPMSCPAGAFVSETDLVVLDPSAEHTLRWGLQIG